MRWISFGVLFVVSVACSPSGNDGDHTESDAVKSDPARNGRAKTPAMPRHDDYPKGVPDPPFAEIVDVKWIGKTATVRMKTDRMSIIESAQWFSDRLKRNGWKQSTSAINETASYIVFRKDGRNCTVTITSGDSETAVRILVSVGEQ